MTPMITVCRGCCGTHQEPVCPACGMAASTGSEQIHWNEKSGFDRAEIIGDESGFDRREIVGNRDIVGNFREIIGRLGHIGAIELPLPSTPAEPASTPASPPVAAAPPKVLQNMPTAFEQAWRVIGMLSTPALIYHGYKRNDSVLSALGWGFLSIVWPISLPIAIGMGFAKPSATQRLLRAARAEGY